MSEFAEKATDWLAENEFMMRNVFRVIVLVLLLLIAHRVEVAIDASDSAESAAGEARDVCYRR